MWMTPEYQKAQENMQPGVITSDGFLGDDTRNILEIINDDEQEMTRLGIDFDEAADKLREIMTRGRAGLGEPTTVENSWIVQVYEARGHLPSPFEDGIFRKVNAQIEYAPEGKRSGSTILVSDLSLHLMKKWHFLQGKGSPFRIEPFALKKVLP
ncbi:MAG: hypothetical protein ACOC47_08555 [Alkalispirochaetaceae bacterium]